MNLILKGELVFGFGYFLFFYEVRTENVDYDDAGSEHYMKRVGHFVSCFKLILLNFINIKVQKNKFKHKFAILIRNDFLGHKRKHSR